MTMMMMMVVVPLQDVDYSGSFVNIQKFNIHNDPVRNATITVPLADKKTDDQRGKVNFPSHRVSN